MKLRLPPPVIFRKYSTFLDFRPAFPIKSSLIALIFVLLSAASVSAATFTANSHATLVSAINSANGNGEDDIINITANIDLAATLSEIDGRQGNLTIRGYGSRYTIDGKGSHKIFDFDYLGGGKVENLTLVGSNGPAVGISQCCLSGGGRLEVTNVVVRNTSTRAGSANAAINAGSGTNILRISNSAIYNNQTNGIFGGSQSKITIVNSSIFGNTGDGIREGAQSAEFRLRHVTVTGNTGIGLNMQGGDVLDARNSIIYGNTGKDCRIGYTGTDVTVRGSIIGASADERCKTGQSTSDPLLTLSASGLYYQLQSESRAINAVSCIVGRDQRGVSRPQGCRCDIGAYEFEESPCPEEEEEEEEEEDSGPWVPPPTATPFSSCLTLPANVAVVSGVNVWTQCQTLPSYAIGNDDIAATAISAIDVYGWVLPTTQLCFPVTGGSFKFIDTAPVPRVVSDLPAFSANGMVCASIDRPGMVILLPGPPPQQPSATPPPPQSLSVCMVTTTAMLNFRASPGGDIIGGVPYDVTLTALERTADWFKVDYHGSQGWISAAYTKPQGSCG